MRAAVISHYHQPWELRGLPDPRPGRGQVLLRVAACGMCGTDLHLHHGIFALPTPLVAGHEVVGEVVELGPGVTELAVGDRVGVHWHQRGCGRCGACHAGEEAACELPHSWMNLGGGYAELTVAWACGCMRLPDGVDPAAAAPMFCAGHAVLSGLRSAHPRPGERIAVLGVGGLGHIALQISQALGFATLALTGQESKAAELRRLGADEVLVVGEEPGPALAAAGGADVVLSTTDSGRQVRSVLEALQPGGRLVDMGVTDGPTGRWCMAPGRWLHASLRRHADEPANLLTDNWLADDGSIWERQHVAQALQLVAAGKVRPVIETYPLAEVNAARERLAGHQVRYSAVLLN